MTTIVVPPSPLPPTGGEAVQPPPVAAPPAPSPFVVAPADAGMSLVNAFFATSPGLVVDPASVVVIRGGTSVAFYDGSLALGIGPGILLTSGTVPGTSNTVGWFGVSNGMNGDPDLDAVVNKAFQTTSYDATSLSFDFTVTDPSITGISFNVVFGTDEYPEWVDAFVDIAVVMVNGVNVAYFGNDPNAPLSVISQNLAAGYFIDNSGSGLPIEYDGVSKVLTVFSPVHQGLNTIKIAVADTGDHIYDSGLFISNFQSTNLPVTGVVVNEPCTEGADDIVGSGGGEIIDGLGGDDSLDGAAGDDILSGGGGNDNLLGGLGADFIDGGSGIDVIDGGAGDDSLQFSGEDSIDGGTGTDKLLIDLSASANGVVLDLSNPAAISTLADGSSFTNIEVLSFVGGSGDDQVTGGAFADQIAGGAGADVLNGGGGNDVIDGGDGADVALFSGASSDYLVNAVSGGVSVQDLRPGAPSGIDTLFGIETLRFSDGDFLPSALVQHGEAIIGTFNDDVVSDLVTVPGQGFATDYADTVSTGAGDDIVSGLGGNDLLDLGADRDMAYGGLGDDRITGGGQDDEIWGDAGTDTAVYSGLQADYLVQELGDGFTITDLRPGSPDGIDSLVGIEYLAFADVTVKLIVGQAPEIVGGDLVANFSEPAAPSGVATLSGSVQFYEANHDDTHTVTLAGMTGDQTGVTFQTSLAADSDGENPGSAAWSLGVDTAQIEALAEGQTRSLSYTIRITDSAGNATDQVVTIDLVGTNDAPVVSGPVTVAISGADAPVTVSAMANVTDVDGGAKPHMSGPPAVLPAGVSFDPIGQTFTFDPHDPALLAQTGGASATIHVDYLVTDGLAEVPARVTFQFTGGNTPPVPAGQVDGGVLSEDGAIASLDLFAAATDPGDTLSVVGGLSVVVTNGVWDAPLAVSVQGGVATVDPGQFNALALGDTLNFQLDYALADSAGSQVAGQAVFTVQGANDAPDALSISATHVNEGAAPGLLVANLLASDVDRGDVLTFSIVADPSGLFAIDGGKLIVAPGAVISAAAASHTLDLRVTDAAGASFVQSMTIFIDSLSGVTILGGKLADLIDATHAPVGQPTVTNAADTISGGLGNDVIHGLGGADSLRGDAGNDSLFGDLGSDTLDGGAGIDVIDGGLGDDVIVVRGVEAIKDSFQGGQGEEALGDAVQAVGLTSVSLTGFNAGAQGIERWIGNGLGIVGGSTAELFNLSSLTAISGLAFVDAGAGNDSLVGSSFADNLRGGSGNDSLDGGAGDDILIGGSGNDQYRIDSVGDQVVELVSGGTDTVLTTVDFSLAGGFVENLTILGAVGRTGVGNAFNNLLNGGDGADSLFGGAGKDVLDGGLGADLLDGGSGDDTYWVNDAGDVIVELAGGGTDKVYATGASYLLSGNLETLVYAGAGAFAGTGNAGANSITGGGLGDSLDGAGGDDKLFGGLGQDTLTGGDGRDTLDGGGDADLLIGGAGNDTYLVDDALDIIVETTAGGLDTVRATASTYALSEEIETLVFAGTGDFNGVGNALGNSITGGAGQDTLSGLGGADRLIGGAGDDVLIGGAGADTLTGGLGADVFAYGVLSDSLMSGQDRIADFNQAQGDLIDLSALDANSLLDGDQAFNFIGSAAFSHTAGEMRFVTAGAMTMLSVDVNGDGVSDFAVRLAGAINLTAGDFLL